MSTDRGGDVGVVVVTYSPGETLDVFLDTLEKATVRPYEVVLADNGSTDGAPDQAALRPGVTLLRTGGNLGYGGAANLGARRVPGEWVVVANPDLLDQRCLEQWYSPEQLESELARRTFCLPRRRVSEHG